LKKYSIIVDVAPDEPGFSQALIFEILNNQSLYRREAEKLSKYASLPYGQYYLFH
jgi:hypothetical protein